LQQELDLQSVREVEDLLIDCMYQGLINGKLDQKLSSLEVYETIGRDITVNDIDSMISALTKWNSEGKKIMTALEQNTKEAVTAFDINKKHQTEFNDKVEDIKKNIRTAIEMQSEGGGLMGIMGMGGMMGMSGMVGGDDRRQRRGPR
jgi:COP9 signalosome complex subunit 7